VAAVKRCANAGKELLAIVDSVCVTANSVNDPLGQSRGGLFQRIQDLVSSARDTLIHAVNEDTDFIMPHDHNVLLSSATGCVRAAGDCIAKAKATIERVGDFEFEFESEEVAIDLSVLDIAAVMPRRKQSIAGQSDCTSIADSARTSASSTPGAQQTIGLAIDKPLPEIPNSPTTPAVEFKLIQSVTRSRPGSQNGESVASKTSSTGSLRPMVALPKLSTTIAPEENPDHDHAWHSSSRFENVVASSAGSSATYLSRDSEASIVSQSSTRATTPDHTLAPRTQPSMSELSTAASSAHTEEVDEVESRLQERTYIHELMFNKEGQVTGGSLPALIERLTTHESAPDAVFVSTFFLTFRLFCTPLKLAESLIDRFEYVGESPHIAGPVRLRVYNTFKGWLESHWNDSTDRSALRHIIAFAEGKLRSTLPHAGHRLVDLTARLSVDRPGVPRLMSAMGKTNTSITQYVPPDTPIPQPMISKGQQSLLTAFKNGISTPTILDFDPLEIARQLTIRQMTTFCSIHPEELLSSQWMKNGGVDAPNVKAMSSMSTDLSNLVADTILQYSEIKKRAAVIKQWIKVASQCLELHNYDGLMAIICSLNSSTISRLRKTWDLISPKRKTLLRTLQKLVEPSQNNKVLRSRLHDHVPPCLPFLGMYLTDLTFVDIGNPATKQLAVGKEAEDNRASGLTVVNFDKHTRTAKIIGDLQRFQIPYRLTEVSDMQDWIAAQINKVREGDQGNVQITYYRKSLLLEPRETTPRTPVDPPAPGTIALVPSRDNLFGWMSRDRSGQQSAVAQT
jgi:hypothetical protein